MSIGEQTLQGFLNPFHVNVLPGRRWLGLSCLVVLCLLSLFPAYFDLVSCKLGKHLTKNLNVLTVDLLKQIVNTSCQNSRSKDIVLIKLNNKRHIAKHLVFLTLSDLRRVKNIKHLLVKIRLGICFISCFSALTLDHTFIKTCPTRSPVFLFNF